MMFLFEVSPNKQELLAKSDDFVKIAVENRHSNTTLTLLNEPWQVTPGQIKRLFFSDLKYRGGKFALPVFQKHYSLFTKIDLGTSLEWAGNTANTQLMIELLHRFDDHIEEKYQQET